MKQNWWTKLGCMLTGWNSEILAQCSGASRSQLNKYTSALLILTIIWGTTGFCFAQRYIGLPIWGCALVALTFITIVIMIERQIILTMERRLSTFVFRGLIALVMAIAGSTILDQTMFGKDINKQMANTIEMQVAELLPQQATTMDKKIATLRTEKDSLENVNAQMQKDVEAHPFIIQTSVSKVPMTKTKADGTSYIVYTTQVTKTEVPNPKIEDLADNKKKVEKRYKDLQEWEKKRVTLEEDLRKQCYANVGFLEELEAMWTIITTRKLACVFYAVIFILLMSLELFVVVSKMGDKKCDYDALLEITQNIKMIQLRNVFENNEQKTLKTA